MRLAGIALPRKAAVMIMVSDVLRFRPSAVPRKPVAKQAKFRVELIHRRNMTAWLCHLVYRGSRSSGLFL